jgi:hypothetical protein
VRLKRGRVGVQQVRLGVVVPAGPRDDVRDTLESVHQFACTSYRIVVVDDTQGRQHIPTAPGVDVIPTPHDAAGGYGGLWVKIAAGYRALLNLCRPELILRMDTDAILTGPGLADAAFGYFQRRPEIGLIGAHHRGPDGGRRDFGPAERGLRHETGLLGLRRPATRRAVRRLVRAAGPDYVPGEHVLGGAYIHRGAAARAMAAKGLLDNPVLSGSRLGEDHLMALATLAAGYRLGDFSGPNEPMAIKWQGLSASPDDLVTQGALIVHSVRSGPGMSESEIRSRFRTLRGAAPSKQREA